MAPSSPSEPAEPGRFTYVGLFLTTLSLLQLELFLTRIFSVTMWYHFAFMAISLAMFGLAGGAVIVEVRKVRANSLPAASLGFAVTSAVCFALQLLIPANPEREIFWTALAFSIITIPFLFAGIVICLGLTRFPTRTGSLYAADLAGSAAGCALAIPFLNSIHAPTAVIFNAAIAGLGALCFDRALRSGSSVRGSQSAWRTWAAALTTLALLTLALSNSSARLVDIRWIKGGWNWNNGLYEKWNALSRIYIGRADPAPFGWGMSPVFEAKRDLDQLYLNIDSGAATVITRFDGDLRAVDHLKYDVTALAYYLRSGRSTLVIGVGGGRDILTALVFGQRRIVGVEINHDILDVLRTRYADYAGNLASRPGVELVHDEARSYISRSNETFGIIQASLIDTWAASSAGAYVLTENGLYTREAWTTFLEHLDPDGILTMSRWYYEAQPAETLRLAALATAALADLGVRNTRDHIAIVRKQDNSETGQYSVATILVSRRPFAAGEIARIETVSREMEFVPVVTPSYAETEAFAQITDAGEYEGIVGSYPLDIAAPSDDKPHFFHMLRVKDLLQASTYQGMNDINLKAVGILGALLLLVTLLSGLVILAPVAVLRGGAGTTPSASLFVYFGAIGLAFMLVEIGQLSRLIVFLGHPIYGLTVVLFVLLLASSLGSATAARFGRWLWALPVLLLLFTALSPMVTKAYASASTPLRIAISGGMLFPLGLLMGMAFPVGMRHAQQGDRAPVAWYWAVNGAFSVVASVLAVAIMIFWGITATLVAGLASYVVALAALFSIGGDRRPVAR